MSSNAQQTWGAAQVLLFIVFISFILGYGHNFTAESKQLKEMRIAAAIAERKREQNMRFNERLRRNAEKKCTHDQWFAREQIKDLEWQNWKESDYIRIDLMKTWQNVIDDNCRMIQERMQKNLRKV